MFIISTRERAHCPKSPLLSTHSPILPHTPLVATHPLLLLRFYLLKPSYIEITQWRTFSDWLLSLSSIRVSFFHVFSWFNSSFRLLSPDQILGLREKLNPKPLAAWSALPLGMHVGALLQLSIHSGITCQTFFDCKF